MGWQLVFDSRHPGNTEWNKIWPWDGSGDNPNDIKTNGLHPLNNAWLMAQSASDPGHIAIAIRGTVSERRSILADAYAATIPAYAGLEYPKDTPRPIAFAATPDAEVHMGFGYAAFSLLFDPQHGILAQLQQRQTQQPITKITITGHSQGAAVATLIHAFLYYATVDRHNPYQLAFAAKPALKSYLFAQPKPGNLQFAQDFARIAAETAYVINNDRDPVPQVPLSLETVTEVSEFVEEDNVSVGNPLDHLIDGVITIKNSVRGSIAEMFTSHVADDFEDTGIAASVQRYFGNSTVTLPDLKARSLS
ncbi:lipase family protein [Methylomonas sp. 2BW1-5-20]|uniref:lipase family protein n=1 Tax=Methylomonas sp. 2BW1-5-20 TaxID=3376686 RepID=UPI004052684C